MPELTGEMLTSVEVACSGMPLSVKVSEATTYESVRVIRVDWVRLTLAFPICSGLSEQLLFRSVM